MPKSRILRDKQNVPVPDTKKGTIDHTKTFKRTNVARHGGSQRVQHTQRKRKYDEVEARQKNTKMAKQSNGEAFQMTADALNILDVALGKVEKMPVPKHTIETQQVNRHVSNSLEILNATIRMFERTATSDNIQKEKKSVLKTIKKTEDTVKNNAVRVGAATPDAIKILNAAIPKLDEYQSAHDYELTTYDQCPEDFLKSMMKLEAKVTKPKHGYMDKQPEDTVAVRSELVDWLVRVFQDTNDKLLHMTVRYMDTILSLMPVVKSKLQLLACAAGMVACKTEKVYIQSAEYWVILGGDIFTKTQLLEMERIILSLMKFQSCHHTIVCFIRHVCYLGKVNAKIVILANYISELVLIEGDVYLRYSPSMLASAIIALARHTLGQSDIWPLTLRAVTYHTLQQLLPLVALLRKTFNNAPNNPNTFVYKKYENKKLLGVAKLKLKQFKPEEIQ